MSRAVCLKRRTTVGVGSVLPVVGGRTSLAGQLNTIYCQRMYTPILSFLPGDQAVSQKQLMRLRDSLKRIMVGTSPRLRQSRMGYLRARFKMA